MKHPLLFWLAPFLLLAAAGAGAAEPDSAAPGPEAALERLLRHPALRGARVGVSVLDLASGEPILGHDARRPMVPASNQKILLAAAALDHWGPAHRFETPVFVEGTIDAAGVLDGTLWVVGAGDPSLVSERLWKLAEELRLRGLSEIRNGIGIDPHHFDGARYHPHWEPVSTRAYHAPTSAFAANYSSFRIEVVPGESVGGSAALRLAPRISYLRGSAELRTLARGGRLQLDLLPGADGSSERVVVRGVVAAGAEPKTYWRAVRHPELYAASLLRAQLEGQGIHVRGQTRIGRRPEGAKELMRFRGAPVGEVVRGMNKYSNNFVAEQLTKALGADTAGPPGTWKSGTAAVAVYLKKIGVVPGELVIADGSGLSARNRVAPEVLVRVLRDASARFDFGPEFLSSLPIGGLDGTLEDRLDPNTPVRGKTGHLSHVGALSGVLFAPGGRRLGFAVLVNGARGGALEIDEAIDAFVVRLGSTLAPHENGLASEN